MRVFLTAISALFLLSCSSVPTRQGYCESLSSEKPISEVNVFENAEQALKKQKSYCEPDVAINSEKFIQSYNLQRDKKLKDQCRCEVVVFKSFEKGFAVNYGGTQTAEDWAPLCESVGMKHEFDRGVKQGLVLKEQMKTEFEITQRLGYSTTQIKDRCKY